MGVTLIGGIMKFLLLLMITTFTYAVPRSMKLAAPSNIEVIGKELRLTFTLNCTSDWALDWSRMVLTSDDEGDMAVAVGMVYSNQDCTSGDQLRDYHLTIDPLHYGYSMSEVEGGFIPMDLDTK